MNRLLPTLLLLVVLPPSVGQQKDKPKDQPPKLLYALQLGADAGKTTKLTLRGLRLDTATEVRLGEPKSSGKVIGKGRKAAMPNAQMNVEAVGDTELDVEVSLPAEVPGGVVPIMVIGPGGESTPLRVLVNDDSPRVAEKEPNDGFKQSMAIVVPSVVEASIKQSQDVDVFQFEGKTGEKLRIEVVAARAGSPVAPILTLYDSAGRTLATGEVPTGERDPTIRFTVSANGAYLISVIDAHDQGGPMFVYRLAVRRDK